MAVVTKLSDLFPASPLGSLVPDPARARGRHRVITGTVANAAGDSAASFYHLCDIPADVILSSGCAFSSAGWGFATVQVGTKALPTALLNTARAAILNPIVMGDALHGLPAWQQLGLSAPPANKMIELWCKGPAGATGAGTMPFEIHFRAP